jgi:DNA-binding transcriptional MerR regulator
VEKLTKQYTIQEAAGITQVSSYTLRFYERIGLLHSIPRAKNGQRRYSETDLGWVKFVLLLRATGMPLPQIAAFMQFEKDGQATIDKRLQMLETHRDDLMEHINALQRSLGALDNKIAYYRTTASDVCDCVQQPTEQK